MNGEQFAGELGEQSTGLLMPHFGSKRDLAQTLAWTGEAKQRAATAVLTATWRLRRAEL